MDAAVSCEHCGATYTVDAKKYGGKKIRCKACGKPFPVPTSADEFEVMETEPQAVDRSSAREDTATPESSTLPAVGTVDANVTTPKASEMPASPHKELPPKKEPPQPAEQLSQLPSASEPSQSTATPDLDSATDDSESVLVAVGFVATVAATILSFVGWLVGWCSFWWCVAPIPIAIAAVVLWAVLSVAFSRAKKPVSFSTRLAAFIVCMLFGILVGFLAFMQGTAKANFAEGNRLWDAGNKVEAITKYKGAIGWDVESMNVPGKPLIYQRVIENELAAGNQGAAKDVMRTALSNGVSVSFDSAVATHLWEEVYKEYEAKLQAEWASDTSVPYAVRNAINEDLAEHRGDYETLLNAKELWLDKGVSRSNVLNTYIATGDATGKQNAFGTHQTAKAEAIYTWNPRTKTLSFKTVRLTDAQWEK
ncbi:MAG TPA: MJ0042-type zinc finger domain-containing protein [Planctomycetota bacterium]|jgi:predicted Zn finger-like uncharacterized protein